MRGGGGRVGGSFWVWALSRLMPLYPPSFRRSLGQEMVAVFAGELRKRRDRGRGVVRYGMVTLLGVVYGGLRERIHEARGGSALAREGRKARMGNEIRQNLEGLLRQVRRSPGFAATVVLTLALGIGVTTGVYSVVRGVLLRPLPYPDSGQLVHLTRAGAASLPNISDLADRLASMQELGGAFVPSTVTLTGAGDPVQIRRSFVTSNFFRILALEPALGRWLGAEDVGTARVVLNHRLWLTRFAGDSAIVGRTVTLDESTAEVVGVAPARIGAPFDADVWAALPWGPGEGPRGSRTWRAVEPYGRLAGGWSLDEARKELDEEWTRLKGEYPDADGRWSVGIQTVKAQVTADENTPLRLLFGAAALFLLIACANVANLCLARLESRRREFAVRSALGAGRRRLLGQTWTETLGLSALGGILGVAVAVSSVPFALAWFGPTLPRADQVVMDGGVLAFAVLLTLGTAAAVGAITVMAWGTQDPAEALRTLGTAIAGRTGLLRRSMVVGEVAMALMLVTGLGLLVRSFEKVRETDLGVRTEGVITARLGYFPSSRYPDGASRRALLDRLQSRLEAIPGVNLAAVASHLPLGGCCSNRPFYLADDADRQVHGVEVRFVTPDYFKTLGIPVVAGKDLQSLGPDDPDAALVNGVMARALFGDEDPVGAVVASEGFGKVRIRGVTGSVREFSPEQPPPPMLYVSTRQAAMSGGFLVIRSALPPAQIIPAVRATLKDVDPLLPVDRFRTLDQIVSGYTADRRATTFLMVLLGSMALGLGVVGIYGVMSHAVLGQVREIGVRLALGATRAGVFGRILRSAILLVVPGIIVGTAGALALRRFIRSLLYQVSPLDPLVYGVALLLFVGAALAAAIAPARLAARVEVVEILRES